MNICFESIIRKLYARIDEPLTLPLTVHIKNRKYFLKSIKKKIF
jgi:hypothetical protein